MMLPIPFAIVADAAGVSDMLDQFRNPLTDAGQVAGPTFERIGSLFGALNSQVFAGANTVSSMLDGYKELEKSNPEAPLVKTMQTVENIFSPQAPPSATAPQQSTATTGSGSPLIPQSSQMLDTVGNIAAGVTSMGPQFDPVSTFMGDGQETINLNDLLGSVGVGGATGGGIMSSLVGNAGAQSLMSSGTNALFGVMRQMQDTMGPGSQGNGRILPALVNLTQSGLANASNMATESSNVPSIAPFLPVQSPPVPSSTPLLNDPPSAIDPIYTLPSTNFNIPPNAAPVPYDYSGVTLNPSTANQSPSQVQTAPAPSAGLMGPVTSGLGSGALGALLGNLTTGGGGGGGTNSILSSVPGKAMEVFSLAQAINAGDSGQMADTVTNLLSSAGSALSQVNTNGLPLLGGQSVPQAAPTTPSPSPWNLEQVPPASAPVSAPSVNDAALTAGSPADDIAQALNEKLLGSQRAKEVEPLPGWMLPASGSARRLQASEPLESCYLVDRNLVGHQITNMRAWSIENCQLLCQSTNLCQYWSYAPQIALCYMYEIVTGTVEQKNMASGPRECPASTDTTVPTDFPTANDFLFGLANPLRNILGGGSEEVSGQSVGSGSALGTMQRLMVGSNGANPVSSVLAPKSSDSSTYHMLGSKFADGFETGGEKLLGAMPNVLGDIFGDPDQFKEAVALSNGLTPPAASEADDPPLAGQGLQGAQDRGLQADVGPEATVSNGSFLERKPTATVAPDRSLQGQAIPPLVDVPQVRFPTENVVQPPQRIPTTPETPPAPEPQRTPSDGLYDPFANPTYHRASEPPRPHLYMSASPPVPARSPTTRALDPYTLKSTESYGNRSSPYHSANALGSLSTGRAAIPRFSAADSVTGQAVPPVGNVDFFQTSSSLAKAGTKFLDTVPMMDFAKAGFQLYNSGFFKSNGLFGGNSTGDKMASLPPMNLGFPRATCTWKGMQCCVPKDSVPKKYKKDPISLNGTDAAQCQAIEYSESDVQELCVTIKFEDSSTSCNTTKFKIEERTIFQATMMMPGKMNNAICECILDNDAYQIDSNADWEVNMVSLKENKEKEEAAEEAAGRVRKSAATALAWTQMITDAASNMGAAAFGDGGLASAATAQSVGGSGEQAYQLNPSTYDPDLFGDSSQWSQALGSLASVKETIDSARSSVVGLSRRLAAIMS